MIPGIIGFISVVNTFTHFHINDFHYYHHQLKKKLASFQEEIILTPKMAIEVFSRGIHDE